MILESAKGYVYCVSSVGVRGQDKVFYDKKYLTDVKNMSKIPVMTGFDIKAAEDIEQYKDVIDGAIAGSYFVEYMESNDYDLEKIKEYIKAFKEKF